MGHMKQILTKAFVVILAASCGLAVAATRERVVPDSSDDRVDTPLSVRMERIGTIRPRNVSEITGSNWMLGCETLDRDYADFDEYKHLIAPLGLKTVRLQGGWWKTEREKGVYDFSWLDKIVDYLRENDVRIFLELSYGNPIYEGGGGWDLSGGFPFGEEGIAGWERWVDAITKRYADKVATWCVWNEPDICDPSTPGGASPKTPEDIAAFNVRTAQAVRKNVPAGKARLAGLALARNDPMFLEKCLKAMGAGLGLFDAIVYHGYAAAPESSYENVERQREVLSKYSPKAVLIQGENGCPSEYTSYFALNSWSWSEYSQAKWDIRRMLGDLGHDVEGNVFTICDFNHVRHEVNRKGLVRANGRHEVIAIKRAYYAVQNVAAVFDDTLSRVKKPCFSTVDLGLEVYEYRTRDGLPVFAFWRSAAVSNPGKRAKGGLLKKEYVAPGDSFETAPGVFEMAAPPLADPVWVDLLTGRIYAFPKKNQLVHSEGVTFVDVPVYDSPCLLAERTAVMR